MKEKIIYRSKNTFNFFCFMFFIRFIFPLSNIMFFLEAKTSEDFLFFLKMSAFILAPSLFFSFIGENKFVITNESLIIVKTTFYRTSIIYPFSAIKGHSLSRELRINYRQPRTYTFKIKVDNIIDTYKFLELSKKSIERLSQVEINKESTTNRREIQTRKSIFNPYLPVLVFNVAFVVYFAILFVRSLF